MLIHIQIFFQGSIIKKSPHSFSPRELNNNKTMWDKSSEQKYEYEYAIS